MDSARPESALIASSEGVLAALFGVVAFWFFVERRSGWRLFRYLPPLIFIYATPVVLSNAGVLPQASPVYGAMSQFALPAFICLMLIGIDVGGAVRIMGKGVLVMLLGSVGVVVGGVAAYAVVRRWLDPEAWRAFAALAGSWIGGTGNMGAMKVAFDVPPDLFGLAVLADNVVYVVWLPVLLSSKALAERFNRWARVPPGRVEAMERAAAEARVEERAAGMVDYLYLGVIAAGVTWVAAAASPALPDWLSAGTWKVLIVTTLGIALSRTPARALPGSHELAMALVYVYVAGIGARASLAGFAQAPAFLAGAFLWIAVHGAFCLAGARIFRVDVHSAAIASAANVGGAASAPVVAAAHRESLVPASILMALIGYAIGNYLAIATGELCRAVAGG